MNELLAISEFKYSLKSVNKYHRPSINVTLKKKFHFLLFDDMNTKPTILNFETNL